MVIRRIEKLRGKLNITTDTMMYAIMDDMVDTFIPLVRSTEIEIDSIDELVLVLSESEQSDMLRRIWSARKRVTQLYRLLFAKSDVLKALTKRSSDFLKPRYIAVSARHSGPRHCDGAESRALRGYSQSLAFQLSRADQY